MVLGFVLWAFAARKLGVDAFGQTQLGVAVGTYLALLVSVGTNLLGISELHQQPSARAYVLRIQAIRLTHAVFVVFVLAGVALAWPEALPGVIALCAASVVIRELWPEWVDVALGTSRRVVGVRTAYFLLVLPSVLLLVRSPSDAMLFCGILAVAALVVALPAWRFTLAGLRRRDESAENLGQDVRQEWSATWSRTLRRSLPLGAAGALGQLVANADILLLGALASENAVAQYGAACRVLFAVQGVGLAFRLSSLRAAAEPGPDREKYEWDLFTMTLLVSVGVASVCSMLASFVVPVAFGPEYPDSVPLLRILAWSWPLDFASAILLNSLIVRGRRRRYVIAMSLAAGANIVANILLIPRFGASAAAAVTVASLALLLTVLLVRPVVTSAHRPGRAMAVLLAVVLVIGLLGSVAMNSGLTLLGLCALSFATAVATVPVLRRAGPHLRGGSQTLTS